MSRVELAIEKVKHLEAKVEDYRKKAAGFGGLFGQGQKRVDAMYALLLENESLEEALLQQNDKLRQERTDSLKEQMRSTGYRRVLMSQLLNDERIKNYVAEVMADEKRLPAPQSPTATKPCLRMVSTSKPRARISTMYCRACFSMLRGDAAR